jgi:hypothetical protein
MGRFHFDKTPIDGRWPAPVVGADCGAVVLDRSRFVKVRTARRGQPPAVAIIDLSGRRDIMAMRQRTRAMRPERRPGRWRPAPFSGLR